MDALAMRLKIRTESTIRQPPTQGHPVLTGITQLGAPVLTATILTLLLSVPPVAMYRMKTDSRTRLSQSGFGRPKQFDTICSRPYMAGGSRAQGHCL